MLLFLLTLLSSKKTVFLSRPLVFAWSWNLFGDVSYSENTAWGRWAYKLLSPRRKLWSDSLTGAQVHLCIIPGICAAKTCVQRWTSQTTLRGKQDLLKMYWNISCDTEIRREKNIADGVLKPCLCTEFLCVWTGKKNNVWMPHLVSSSWLILWEIVPQWRQVWKRQGEKVNKEQRLPYPQSWGLAKSQQWWT